MPSAIFERAAELWAEMSEDYLEYVLAAYVRAETATHGVMVNEAGREKGLTGLDLFTGPRHRAARYASDELAHYWRFVAPRPTREAYEAEWLHARGFL